MRFWIHLIVVISSGGRSFVSDDLTQSRDLLGALPKDDSVPANSRSFDFGSGLASESAPCAQDDNLMKDAHSIVQCNLFSLVVHPLYKPPSVE